MGHYVSDEFVPLNIAVLTVSDTRTQENDSSGRLLATALTDAGHRLLEKAITIDDVYQIRAWVSKWIASDNTQVVLITGGTGMTARDNTPEAVSPLFDKMVDGFGELFRQVSYEKIGSSTVQSRALAGLSNGTLMFCIPGSTNACRDAWELIEHQLDARHGPCNFVQHLKQSVAALCNTRG